MRTVAPAMDGECFQLVACKAIINELWIKFCILDLETRFSRSSYCNGDG